VLAMDPRQSVALELLEGDSPLGIYTLPEYTTGVAGKAYPTSKGSPWLPTEAPCLSCTSACGTRGGDASGTTGSQERARRRARDTPNGLTARLSPNCCLAKIAYWGSRRVSCSYGTFLEHPISARSGKLLPLNRGATSTWQKIGAGGYGDLLFRHSPGRISRYELLRCLAG
jgi:hypothetical protein